MKVPLAVLVLVISAVCTHADEPAQFNRDIRPILAEHCWQCHGPDANARKAGLRLDLHEAVIMPADSGAKPVMPGDADSSEVIRRVISEDPDLQMPPPSLQKPLSADQIQKLRQWIDEGAHFQQHWAFENPIKAQLPNIADTPHPVDAWVLARLQPQGLSLSPEANRNKLLRRVSFDLTGLPPSTADLDRTEETYEQAVDRLLDSPHFGEHMAVEWLDLARYADTNGYFSDKPRTMWLWRDWVIKAFNSNMPYEQFTIEQLAGDLLPNCTVNQKIATGFNRNHMANNETGIIDEEFRVEYVVDRVDTTMTTWMGLTTGCAQCHDHKFDPISQKEFYQLFAFFNNGPETGLITTDNPPPLMSVSTPDQEHELKRLQVAAAKATADFEPVRGRLSEEITTWETEAARALPQVPENQTVFFEPFQGRLSANTTAIGTKLIFHAGVRGDAARFDATQHTESMLTNFNADKPWTIGFWISPDGSLSCPVSKIEPEGARTGLEFLWKKGRLTVNLVHQWNNDAVELSTQTAMVNGEWHHVVATYDGSRKAAGLQIFLNGLPAAVDVHQDSLTGSIVNNVPLLIGRRDSGLGLYGVLDELRILQRSVDATEVAQWTRAERIRGILDISPASRNGRQSELLLDDFISHKAMPEVRELRKLILDSQQAEKKFRESIPTALIMEDLPTPRQTHILNRGQYDQTGEAVHPGVPASLSAWPGDAPQNRLGFAKWLTSDQNPLTARVAVNRFWKQCFGEGLVRTMNDFGTQGEPPTHPELLDWLAVHFQQNGWDVKAMLRLIVTSKTYRQSSVFRVHDGTIFDPANRFLSRGPSFRMSAEMLRDQALAVSGLLQTQVGGPSVKPYQPDGLWEEVSYNEEDSYLQDHGPGLWRRSLYTYLKRQVPPPWFLAFDGITREKCTVQRARTNTPQQSLILLNDVTWMEAARVLATTHYQSQVTDESTRLGNIFRTVLSRWPEKDELDMLTALLNRQRSRFHNQPALAEEILHIGETPLPVDTVPIELASWTIVAHTVLNLDEATTRR